MICRVCESESRFVHQAKILRKYNINYYYCDYCEYLQTEDPFWLDEAYQDPINIYDTGILSRNISLAESVSTIINFWFNPDGRFLDFAGGYGIFVRLMRDNGYNFFWNDPYCQNIFARGFEKNKESKPLTLVTCFEVFEHFSFPYHQVQEVANQSSNIMFSTQLLPDPIPTPDDWWYYGLDHGQHIGFFRRKTLQYLADRLSLQLFSDNQSLHLWTDKAIFPKAVPGSWNGARKLLRQIRSCQSQSLNLLASLSDEFKWPSSRRIDRYVIIPPIDPDQNFVEDAQVQVQLDNLFRYLVSESKRLNQCVTTPKRNTKILDDMNDLIGRQSAKD